MPVEVELRLVQAGVDAKQLRRTETAYTEETTCRGAQALPKAFDLIPGVGAHVKPLAKRAA